MIVWLNQEILLLLYVIIDIDIIDKKKIIQYINGMSIYTSGQTLFVHPTRERDHYKSILVIRWRLYIIVNTVYHIFIADVIIWTLNIFFRNGQQAQRGSHALSSRSSWACDGTCCCDGGKWDHKGAGASWTRHASPPGTSSPNWRHRRGSAAWKHDKQCHQSGFPVKSEYGKHTCLVPEANGMRGSDSIWLHAVDTPVYVETASAQAMMDVCLRTHGRFSKLKGKVLHDPCATTSKPEIVALFQTHDDRRIQGSPRRGPIEPQKIGMGHYFFK